eukprot:scaffold2059_cov342-Prasinococcus_capsulatus_cf.AAC.5
MSKIVETHGGEAVAVDVPEPTRTASGVGDSNDGNGTVLPPSSSAHCTVPGLKRRKGNKREKVFSGPARLGRARPLLEPGGAGGAPADPHADPGPAVGAPVLADAVLRAARRACLRSTDHAQRVPSTTARTAPSTAHHDELLLAPGRAPQVQREAPGGRHPPRRRRGSLGADLPGRHLCHPGAGQGGAQARPVRPVAARARATLTCTAAGVPP